jgi:hypothetical protein
MNSRQGVHKATGCHGGTYRGDPAQQTITRLADGSIIRHSAQGLPARAPQLAHVWGTQDGDTGGRQPVSRWAL